MQVAGDESWHQDALDGELLEASDGGEEDWEDRREPPPPPPHGSVVLREDLEWAAAARGASAAAAKAVAKSLADAKAHQRELRLRQFVSAKGLEDAGPAAGTAAVHGLGDKHASALLSDQYDALAAHRDALEQELLSKIEVRPPARPLRPIIAHCLNPQLLLLEP